jgi:Glycosyl transferases group 1
MISAPPPDRAIERGAYGFATRAISYPPLLWSFMAAKPRHCAEPFSAPYRPRLGGAGGPVYDHLQRGHWRRAESCPERNDRNLSGTHRREARRLEGRRLDHPGAALGTQDFTDGRGRRPERDALRALATRIGVAGRVSFPGQLSPSVLRGIMREYDAFVLAAEYEGLPHIVLGPMQENLPVIATRIGGAPEVVRHGETGLLVHRDPQMIAAAIDELRRHPHLAEMLVARANRLLERDFSMDRMLAETESLLRSVVLERRRA